jgi:hypothetical protein
VNMVDVATSTSTTPHGPGPDRRAERSGRSRLRTLVPVLVVWGFGLAILAVVAMQRVVPPEVLLTDAANAPGGQWYNGAVTSLGILAWTVAAGGCATTAFVCGLDARPAGVRAFRWGTIVLAVLTFDDLFQIHSGLGPQWLGVPKEAMLGLYGLACAAWVVGAWVELRRTRWELLAAASAVLATSLVIEFLGSRRDVGLRVVFEDGAKFLGVLALAVWSVSTARDVVRSTLGTRRARPSAGGALDRQR